MMDDDIVDDLRARLQTTTGESAAAWTLVQHLLLLLHARGLVDAPDLRGLLDGVEEELAIVYNDAVGEVESSEDKIFDASVREWQTTFLAITRERLESGFLEFPHGSRRSKGDE
jgi:hypothetical protein